MSHNNRLLITAIRNAMKAGATAAITLGVLPYSGFTLAQESGARMLEEVVVTARRREETAQSVPISVTAFDAGALETFKIDNLDDLQRFDPSFTVSSTSARPNAPVYSLRGVRPTEAIYGQDPTVAIYMADVVLSPAKGSNLGMFDLESVQILKGPQGTLFGRNTTGGAILLTPQRPGDVFGGNLMFGMGNFGHKEAQLAVDLPVTDNFSLRFAGRMTDSEGYQTNVAPGPFYRDKRGGGDTQSGRLSGLWQINDVVENHTILTWDQLDLNGRSATLQAVRPGSTLALYNGGAPLGLPSIFDSLERAQNRSVYDIESDMRETSEVEVKGLINTTTFDINDNLSVKSIFGYRDVEAYEVVDLDATAISGVLTSSQTSSLEHASYELQLLGSALEDKLDWVTGVYWYREEGIEDSPGNVLLGVAPSNPFMQYAEMKNDSYSLFAQGTYQFTDQWSLTGGIRWTYDKKEMTLRNRTPAACGLFDPAGSPLPLDRCEISLSESFDQPTGTLSVEYKPSNELMLYAASRYGYRAGGFNARATQLVAYEPFEPETVLDVELGAKMDWYVGDWSMRTNVALYHQWYDDIQRTINTINQFGVPAGTVQNAAQAEVLGVEIEQVISPTEHLTLRLQYAYTDPEYKSWSEAIDADTTRDLSDTPFYFTPEHAFTGTLSYEYPLDDAGLLRFSTSASYQGDVWTASLQTIASIRAHPEEVRHALRQDAYWLVDASIDWERVMGSNVDISLWGKNLTNEEYTSGGVMLYHTLGLSTKVYMEPRTFGLQARYRF